MIFVHFRRHLLTWGAGLFGQLGNNELEDKATAQDTTNFIYPQAGKIVQVSWSLYAKNYAHWDDMRITWRARTHTRTHTRAHAHAQVSAGCGHTGLITEKGYAFTCGDDRYNQLGECLAHAAIHLLYISANLPKVTFAQTGHSDFRGKLCTVPKRVTENLGGVRCVQIACGSSHTLFLTEQVCLPLFNLQDSIPKPNPLLPFIWSYYYRGRCTQLAKGTQDNWDWGTQWLPGPPLPSLFRMMNTTLSALLPELRTIVSASISHRRCLQHHFGGVFSLQSWYQSVAKPLRLDWDHRDSWAMEAPSISLR